MPSVSCMIVLVFFAINRTCCGEHCGQNAAGTNVCFLLTEHVVENPTVEEQVQRPHRRKEMFEHLRKQVYQALLARSNNGKLGKNDTTIVAEQFGLNIRSVQRVWQRGKIQLASSVLVVVSSLKKGRVGRK